LSLAHKTISPAIDRKDILRTGGLLLDLFPNFEDMVVDGAGGGEGVVTPDLVEQGIPGNHLLAVLYEIPEDFRFECRQLQFQSFADGLELCKINGDITKSVAVYWFNFNLFLVPEPGFDPCQQLADAERLVM